MWAFLYKRRRAALLSPEASFSNILYYLCLPFDFGLQMVSNMCKIDRQEKDVAAKLFVLRNTKQSILNWHEDLSSCNVHSLRQSIMPTMYMKQFRFRFVLNCFGDILSLPPCPCATGYHYESTATYLLIQGHNQRHCHP